MSTKIREIEYALPDFILTNEMLAKENPNWDMDKVYKKSGVLKRHIAGAGETALDLSTKACDKLFSNNRLNKEDIDGIIYCTQSPDYIMPSNSFLLHKHMGLPNEVFVYDFNHACTGFIYGLAMAHAFISSGISENILLVTADTYSKYINKRDRSARVLFGDGAAVTIIEKSEKTGGVIDIELASSGNNFDAFYIPAGGQKLPRSAETEKEISDSRGNIRSKNDICMDGMRVWAFINSVVPSQITTLIERNGLQISDVDLFVFHQASLMTLESIIKILGLEPGKVFVNIKNIGNTVSASIPIALKDALDHGKIKKGSKILLSGFGVGMAYGSILIEL